MEQHFLKNDPNIGQDEKTFKVSHFSSLGEVEYTLSKDMTIEVFLSVNYIQPSNNYAWEPVDIMWKKYTTTCKLETGFEAFNKLEFIKRMKELGFRILNINGVVCVCIYVITTATDMFVIYRT